MALFLRIKPLTLISVQYKLLQQCRQLSSSKINMSTLRIRSKPSANKIKNYMEKDKIDNSYDLIYRAPMENYISITNLVSTITAGLIASLAAYKCLFNPEVIKPIGEISFAGLVAYDNDIGYLAGGFVLINLAIRIFIAKYPMRIYKSSVNYVAAYNSQIPFCSTQHKFLKGDVTPVKNMFNPWQNSTYRLGNRNSLLLIDYFRTPSEFHNMCTPAKTDSN